PPASAPMVTQVPSRPSQQSAPATSGPLPEVPSQAPQYASPQPDVATVATEEAPPPAATWTAVYPTGQWVYTADHGWIWIPNGTAAAEYEGVPYVYFYTPVYGWNWYVSPWGWGPYHYGGWVRYGWHPVGWHGVWVARPHVGVHFGGWHGGVWHGGG